MAKPRMDARRQISPSFNRFIDGLCMLIQFKGPYCITEKTYSLPIRVIVSLLSQAQYGSIAH